ncbi:unnamed protein product, partial [Rotaria sordida]
AGWADKITDETLPSESGISITYIKHESVGIYGQIISCTIFFLTYASYKSIVAIIFKTVMLALKLGSALVCGNVVILKPAEQTPLAALFCVSVIKEASLPPGIINSVPGNTHHQNENNSYNNIHM